MLTPEHYTNLAKTWPWRTLPDTNLSEASTLHKKARPCEDRLTSKGRAPSSTNVTPSEQHQIPCGSRQRICTGSWQLGPQPVERKSALAGQGWSCASSGPAGSPSGKSGLAFGAEPQTCPRGCPGARSPLPAPSQIHRAPASPPTFSPISLLAQHHLGSPIPVDPYPSTSLQRIILHMQGGSPCEPDSARQENQSVITGKAAPVLVQYFNQGINSPHYHLPLLPHSLPIQG